MTEVNRTTAELASLFQEWRTAVAAVNAATEDDDANNTLYDAAMAAAAAVMAAVPVTPGDFALKLIVADDDGDASSRGSFSLRELVREAYAVAGVDGWTNDDEAELREWRDAVVPAQA
jgi:hypothetical protein